jgi:hypothetical protein
MHGLLAKINRKDLAILANLVQSGTVIPVAERTYSLREIAELLRHVESGHVRGKVVIAVAQTPTWGRHRKVLASHAPDSPRHRTISFSACLSLLSGGI